MIEPLVLPEAAAVKIQKFCGLVPGPTLELLKRVLELPGLQLEEEMNVTRHKYIFKHPPRSPAAKLDCVHDHSCDGRILEMRGIFRSIQPGFHLCVDVPL